MTQEKRKQRAVSFLDLGVLVGLVSTIYGLWLIYRPLGPLVGGLLLTAACWFLEYAPSRKGERQ